MPETNSPSAVIKIKFFTRWRLAFLEFAERFLFFFNLKNSKRFWGIVYDSASKQPLDPVIVKLVYTDGYEVEQAFTDMGGAYGFLARKGKFKILPRKTNYSFPSKFVSGDRDGIYENLYHGEFFTLYEDGEVVAPNIPMDPENFDWNQQAKKQVINTHPYGRLFLRKFFGVLFWFGFAFSLLDFWGSYRQAGFWLYFVLAVYFIIIFLAVLLPEPRLWGKVIGHGQVPANLFLELHNAAFPSVTLGSAAVNENGKFLLRANKGKYLLSISSVDSEKNKHLLGSIPVTVGKSRVLNESLIVRA
jgi:hypothetical protein